MELKLDSYNSSVYPKIQNGQILILFCLKFPSNTNQVILVNKTDLEDLREKGGNYGGVEKPYQEANKH